MTTQVTGTGRRVIPSGRNEHFGSCLPRVTYCDPNGRAFDTKHGSRESLLMTRNGFTLLVVIVQSITAFGDDALGVAAGDAIQNQERRLMAQYRDEVRPLLLRYCSSCHGESKQKASIRFDRLDPNMASGDDGETWHDALNELNQGNMPPAKANQPKPSEREAIVSWLTAELKRATAVRRSTGGRVVMRRLTRYEYANTMRDLLGVDVGYSEGLPPEAVSPDGFKNNGMVLRMSPRRLEHYLQVARRAMEKAIVIGDQPEVVRFENERIGGESYGQGTERQLPSAGAMKFPPAPVEGPFRLRVTASAETVADAKAPVLGIHLGYRNSPNNFRLKLVGEVKLKGTASNPQTIELSGYMEQFPHPDPSTPIKERRNPGLRMGFSNSYYEKYPAGIWAPLMFDDRGRPAKPDHVARFTKQAKKATLPGEEGQPRIRIHSVVYESPYYETWPPEHHTQILFPSSLREEDEFAYARLVINRFMSRAYRRPATKAEVGRLMRVYKAFRPKVDSLELAMREVLPEVLIAPEFLYLMEPTVDAQRQRLTDHELASRLSYFLWSTMPDAALFKAAGDGRLRKDATLDATARRMIKDDRIWAFVANFTDQWLKLDELNRIAINPEYYPSFDSRLKNDMRLETQHFIAEILRNDLSALNLIDSDFTMLNRAMAKHYGVKGPQGVRRFERVVLRPEHHRGGLLGHASVLLRNSNGDDSHPIYRGTWIKDRLLGDPPASPPPDVPELKTDDSAFATLPLRRQLEIHRDKESCNSCHRRIDPWGIPLEHFDATGQWRTTRKVLEEITKGGRKGEYRLVESKTPIEVDSILANGTSLDGFESLKAYLISQEKDRFARAFVRHVLSYALGRNLEIIDEQTVDTLAKRFIASDYQIDELLVDITKSEPFRMK